MGLPELGLHEATCPSISVSSVGMGVEHTDMRIRGPDLYGVIHVPYIIFIQPKETFSGKIYEIVSNLFLLPGVGIILEYHMPTIVSRNFGMVFIPKSHSIVIYKIDFLEDFVRADIEGGQDFL